MNQEKIADLKNWMHQEKIDFTYICLLYTSDAADE